MKTKYWVCILAALFAAFAALSFLCLRPGTASTYAEICSEGALLRTVDLRIDQRFTVESSRGANTITVVDGKIAVTEASCPDHYCMKRGALNTGRDIICLPNQLVIHFIGDPTLDAIAG